MSIQTAQRQLLKSLSIMGSSQLGIMAVNVIKTKLFSLFLGVEGIGLIGLFTSLIDLIRSVSGLGLQDSGVRYIADKSVNDSEIEKEKEIFVLRRWILFTAFLGAAICFFAATPLCWYMFESHEYVDAVRMLSVCVFIAAVASGQTAIMQALKQIPALAMTNLTSTQIGSAHV